jgi:hypothetical protein
LAFTAAILDDRLPIAVGFRLVVGHHLEAYRLVRREHRAAIQTDEGLAEQGELDGQLAILFAARVIGCGLKRLSDMAVRKRGGVEFRCVAGLAMIEPKTRDDFSVHGNFPTVFDDTARYQLAGSMSITACFKTRLSAGDSRL